MSSNFFNVVIEIGICNVWYLPVKMANKYFICNISKGYNNPVIRLFLFKLGLIL